MGQINFDDLQGERSYSAARAYNQSKLANVLFTYELARRLKGTSVTANALHPGAVRTSFGAEDPGLIQRLFTPFMGLPDVEKWSSSDEAGVPPGGSAGRYGGTPKLASDYADRPCASFRGLPSIGVRPGGCLRRGGSPELERVQPPLR